MSDGVVKYVFGGVGSNVDSEVVNEDDKVVELVVEDEVDSENGICVGEGSKYEVGVRFGCIVGVMGLSGTLIVN